MPSATTVSKGGRGDFGWSFQLLSLVLSTLAIVALARHAFVKWSLSAPMALVMDAYNGTMQVLCGWAQPYLQTALTWLGSFIGWRPTLYPHWRDVFVVVGLFSAAGGRLLLRNGKVAIAAVVIIVGVFGALIAATIAGVLPLQSSVVGQLVVGAVLGFAFTPLAVSVAVGAGFVAGLVFILLFAAFGALVTFLLYLFIGNIAGLGLVGLAVANVLVGAYYAPQVGERDNMALGRSILGGFIGAFIFFACDAGLKLLGT